ncbi:MAG: ATP-binding protein [Candidatus Latescibacterota bacterium]|nr:MAG: ATP-binding protein [Candidatus Latescibacterota bacterium]
MAKTVHWETVELAFPSSLEYLPLVNAVAEEVADRLGVERETRDAIDSSVIEACTNAIEHGNKKDRTKEVRIRFRTNGRTIEIEVSDQGEGFDPAAVKDPRRPENLMRERGRGIFILRAFMDEVQFRVEPSRGTTVRLVKRLAKAASGGGA